MDDELCWARTVPELWPCVWERRVRQIFAQTSYRVLPALRVGELSVRIGYPGLDVEPKEHEGE